MELPIKDRASAGRALAAALAHLPGGGKVLVLALPRGGLPVAGAIGALRESAPARVIVAVPVAPPGTVEMLRHEADEVVCLATPQPFVAIGKWYREFPQLDDDTVRALLRERWSGGR